VAHDVFVSYPSTDKATADAAVNALESRGVRCWFAPRDVPPGTEWAGAIVGAIRDARLMVLVFSEATNASEHILREVRQAADADVPIVPFRTTPQLPNPALDYYIGGTHWLDALSPPLERHLSQLVETSTRLLGRPAAGSRDAAPTAARTAPIAPDAAPPARHRRLDRRVALVAAAAVGIVSLALAAVAVLGGGDEVASGSSPAVSAGSSADSAVGLDLGWRQNPATGNWYARTEPGRSWEELEALARELGGHLVSIGDEAEEAWLFSQFGPGEFWIGLTDQAVEGEWAWTSGEAVDYLNWCPGEPTDTAGGAGPEDAAYAIPVWGCWFDEGVWWTEFVDADGATVPGYPGVIERDQAPD
jgi:hypothetical protein